MSANTWVNDMGFDVDEDDDEGRGPRHLTIKCVLCDDYILRQRGNSPTDDMHDHAELHVECSNPTCDEVPLLSSAFMGNVAAPVNDNPYCNENCFLNHIEDRVAATPSAGGYHR